MARFDRRLTRRRLGAFGLALAVTNACAAGSPAVGTNGAGSVAPSSRKWLFTQNGNFVHFDLASRKETQITRFNGALASSPALSPDRKRVAYVYYVLPTNPNDLGGSDLYVMNVDGSNQKLVRSHGQPDTSFLNPCWSPDGQAIYTTLKSPIMVGGQQVGSANTIYRVPLDASAPVAVTDGDSPAISSDGRSLALLTTDKGGITHLLVGKIDGSNAREPLANRGFTAMQGARYSPDGKYLAFAAVGGPAGASAGRPPSPDPLLALFVPGVAEADGTPMDVWTVQPDGSNLRRLTSTLDHSPFPAWSPDGKWLAVAGELSLTLVDATGSHVEKVSSNAKATGVVWL